MYESTTCAESIQFIHSSLNQHSSISVCFSAALNCNIYLAQDRYALINAQYNWLTMLLQSLVSIISFHMGHIFTLSQTKDDDLASLWNCASAQLSKDQAPGGCAG